MKNNKSNKKLAKELLKLIKSNNQYNPYDYWYKTNEYIEVATENQIMRMYSATKKKFMECITECDALLNMYFSIVKESSLESNDESAMLLRTMIDAYLKNSITKWEYRML